jgi:Protein of unknown function (DUF732)
MFALLSVTRCAASAIAAASLGLAAVAGAGPAGASPADENFLDLLANEGITFSSPSVAIQAGQDICSALAGGVVSDAVRDEIRTSTNLSDRQMSFLIGGAVSNYCPQFNGMVGD